MVANPEIFRLINHKALRGLVVGSTTISSVLFSASACHSDDGSQASVQIFHPTPYVIDLTPISAPLEDFRFSPSWIQILSVSLDFQIEQGKSILRGANLDWVIPDGGHIIDYSKLGYAGNRTLVLGGHSYWHNEPQPMRQTFSLEKDAEIVIEDLKRGDIKFQVTKVLVLDWEATLKLIKPDKDKGTIVTFTTLRDEFDHPEKLKQSEAIERSTNKKEAQDFYNSTGNLYWVVVAEEEQ